MDLVNPETAFTWTEPLDINGVPMLGVPEKQGWSFSRQGWLAAQVAPTMADPDDYGRRHRKALRPLSAPTLADARRQFERRDAGRFPPYFIIEPTATCGRRCSFCSINVLRRIDADGREVRPGMLAWPAFEKLMRECAGYWVYGISLYQLGEPMDYAGRDEYGQRRDIGDMILLARELGGFRVVNVSTHGDVRNLRRLLDEPPDDLIISIDGMTAATYDQNRPVTNGKQAGAFERTVARVTEFLADKVRRASLRPFVRLQIINNASTRDEVLPFIRHWIQVPGVDDVFVKALDSMRPWLGDRVVSNAEDQHKAAALADMPCQHIYAVGSMTASGTLNACCHDARTELTDGTNIMRTTFADWWDGKYMRGIRARHEGGQFGPICGECRERDTWLGR